MKISSSNAAAGDAVSGFATIDVQGGGERAHSGSSSVASMRAGAALANRLVPDIAEIVSGVKAHAGKVVALAADIEARDSDDAVGWAREA